MLPGVGVLVVASVVYQLHDRLPGASTKIKHLNSTALIFKQAFQKDELSDVLEISYNEVLLTCFCCNNENDRGYTDTEAIIKNTLFQK